MALRASNSTPLLHSTPQNGIPPYIVACSNAQSVSERVWLESKPPKSSHTHLKPYITCPKNLQSYSSKSLTNSRKKFQFLDDTRTESTCAIEDLPCHHYDINHVCFGPRLRNAELPVIDSNFWRNCLKKSKNKSHKLCVLNCPSNLLSIFYSGRGCHICRINVDMTNIHYIPSKSTWTIAILQLKTWFSDHDSSILIWFENLVYYFNMNNIFVYNFHSLQFLSFSLFWNHILSKYFKMHFSWW
jgi:hypothetical protein